MRRRVVVVAVLAAVAVVSSSATASPRPHVVDPAGDAVVASHDVLSMTFSTVGRGDQARLRMRVELAGVPDPDVGHQWEVSWRSPGCAVNVVAYSRSVFYPGEDRAQHALQCDGSGKMESGYAATGRLEGTSLILEIPLGTLYPPRTTLSAPRVTAWAAVFVAGVVPSYYRADWTEPGSAYRVGGRG